MGIIMIPLLKDDLAKEFAVSLIVAATFFILGKSWGLVGRFVQTLRQAASSFTVSGFWVGTCVLPSYNDSPSIEIWRITQKDQAISLKFFEYKSSSERIDKCTGSGVFRGGLFSAIYYSTRPDSYESGVLALRLRGMGLSGVYAQYDVGKSDEKFFASDTTYELFRVRLSWRRALLFAFGRKPFKDFAEVSQFCSTTPLRARLSGSNEITHDASLSEAGAAAAPTT